MMKRLCLMLALVLLVQEPADARWHKRRHYRPAAPADWSTARKVWKPKWWPKGAPRNRAVIVIRLASQRLVLQDAKAHYTQYKVSTGVNKHHPTPVGYFKIS